MTLTQIGSTSVRGCAARSRLARRRPDDQTNERSKDQDEKLPPAAADIIDLGSLDRRPALRLWQRLI
jgi:hypothetical protein